MRALFVGLIVAGIVCGIFVGRRSQSTRTNATSTDAESTAAIEQELQAMRRRLETVESVRGAELGKVVIAGRFAASDAGSSATSAEPKPVARTEPPTNAEAVKTFKGYFEQLDALRGTGDDVDLTAKFTTALSSDEWKDGAPGSPVKRAVSCGNGYCRVVLTFTNAKDGADARVRLMLAVHDLASRTSIFFDPETLQVEGYFATDDKTFPPFPDGQT
jgi:hypothetical protein